MKINVQRFNPAEDEVPYMASYEVPWSQYMTALEALVYIYENYDPIAFDYGCHARSCGRCSMMVDGEPKLACIAAIDDAEHTIAPLAGFPVIRDLIVDNEKMQHTVSMLYKRARVKPLTQEEMDYYPDMTYARTLQEIGYCTRCGACNAVCPAMKADPDYVGPMAMVATTYRFMDPYDQADRVVEAYENGFASCIKCGQCTQVCPSAEVDHLFYWKVLEDAATERGLLEV